MGGVLFWCGGCVFCHFLVRAGPVEDLSLRVITEFWPFSAFGTLPAFL
jgi:hypothetical protein